MALLNQVINFIESLFKSHWFAGFGTTASILGISFTIWQVLKNKNKSKDIEKEIIIVKNDIKKIIDITSITKMIGEIDLARESISNKSLQVARVHFSTLKSFLGEIRSSLHFIDKDDKKIQKCIQQLGTDITILIESERHFEEVDTSSLLEHLNIVNDLLTDWSGKLKKISYETDKH